MNLQYKDKLPLRRPLQADPCSVALRTHLAGEHHGGETYKYVSVCYQYTRQEESRDHVLC